MFIEFTLMSSDKISLNKNHIVAFSSNQSGTIIYLHPEVQVDLTTDTPGIAVTTPYDRVKSLLGTQVNT